MTLTLFTNLILPGNIAVQAASSNSSDTRSRLGINLEGLADWSEGKMFIDMMKTSRTWGSADIPWNALDASQTDQYGWPKIDDCGVVLAHGIKVEAGTYKLSFECDNAAGVEFEPHSCQFGIENVVRGEKTVTADIVVPEGQEAFFFQFHNTNGGIRNMKVLRPGYTDDSQLFTNEFLKFIEPFSTLRFMDYLNTNGQNNGNDLAQIEWANRKTPMHASQAANTGKAVGGCWEYLVELLNYTKKDGWINVPYNASDDYIRKLAKFLKENVDEGINIYVELSNEVWNWSFQQSYVNDALAKTDPIANTYILQFAKQTANMAEIFREVYGQEAMNDNIRVILAWQIGWAPADTLPREMLNYIKNYHDTPSNLIYSLAGAPYFSEPLPQDCTSIDVIHEHMIQSSDDSITGKKEFIQVAVDWNLKGGATCYEGGPHHQGQVWDNLDTRMAAHRDARMQEILIHDLQQNWFDIGGGLFCYFSATGKYSQYGCWALSEKVTDLDTPKYKAIKQLYDENKQYTEVNPSYVPNTPLPSYADGKVLLAYDGFDNTSDSALKNHVNGYGWSGAWTVGNNPEQGYQITSNQPLANSELIASDNYAIGGYAYNYAIRSVDTYRQVATDYRKSNNSLGKVGTTLWASFLMRIESNSTVMGIIDSDTITDSKGIYIGKTSASKEYVSMTFENKDAVSNIPLSNEPLFYVLKYEFKSDNSTTISCWINPSLSADQPEGEPNMKINANATVGIKSFVWYAGDKQNNGSLDEIRLGNSYDVVSPSTYRKPALATPTATSVVSKLDDADFIYRYNFNNNSKGVIWSGETFGNNFNIAIDPKDSANKVLAYTDTSDTKATSEFFTTNCDPEQVYTLQFRAYGDIGHIALSYNQETDSIDYAETSNNTSTAQGIITSSRGLNPGVYERYVANEWNTYVVTFKGSSQYRFVIMSQAGNNVNGGKILLDDIIVYKGDYYEEIIDEYGDLIPDPNPSATPTPSASVTPTPTASATDTDPITTPDASSTVAPTISVTTAPTAIPSSAPDTEALAKTKEVAIKWLESYKNPNDYRDAEKATLSKVLADAIVAIASAPDAASVQVILTSTKGALDKIKTAAQLTVEEDGVKKVKFTRKKINVKVGKKVILKVKLTPDKGLAKAAKKLKWSIDKKGKKVVKFVKNAKKLSGKLKVQLKAIKRGKAKVTCKAPNGKKAVCKIIVK